MTDIGSQFSSENYDYFVVDAKRYAVRGKTVVAVTKHPENTPESLVGAWVKSLGIHTDVSCTPVTEEIMGVEDARKYAKRLYLEDSMVDTEVIYVEGAPEAFIVLEAMDVLDVSGAD